MFLLMQLHYYFHVVIVGVKISLQSIMKIDMKYDSHNHYFKLLSTLRKIRCLLVIRIYTYLINLFSLLPEKLPWEERITPPS